MTFFVRPCILVIDPWNTCAGVLSGEKQRLERSYDFIDVCGVLFPQPAIARSLVRWSAGFREFCDPTNVEYE